MMFWFKRRGNGMSMFWRGNGSEKRVYIEREERHIGPPMACIIREYHVLHFGRKNKKGGDSKTVTISSDLNEVWGKGVCRI